jgi:NADPH:quinone reductase-like Zn-dependent oxidoreductase
VVIDSIGAEYVERSIPVLRPGGIVVSLIERGNAALQAKVEAAGRMFAGISVEPDQVGLAALADLVDAGQLRVHVEEVIPFREVARAHALMTERAATGKLVLAL